MARPKTFKMADHEVEIVEWLVGGNPLEHYSAQPGKPSVGTIYLWAKADAEFADALRIGRQWGTHTLADRALRIAMTPEVGEIVTEEDHATKDGKGIVTTKKRVLEDMLGHRKLLVDTILKLIARWNSGEYGERTQHEHKGKVTFEQLVIESGKPPTEEEPKK